MLKISKLKIKNSVIFSDVSLRLDTGRIIIVRGQNKRSMDQNETNGSGKSLLIDHIPSVLYGKTPLVSKMSGGKKASKEPTTVELTVEKGGSTWAIKQVTKDGTTKYVVHKDEEDQGASRVKDAKTLINSLWPIPESEYYTIWNLNSQVYSTLLRGTTSQRLDFFTKFFDLDIYDRLRTHFRTKLRELSDNDVELNAYLSQLIEVETDIKSLGVLAYDVDKVAELHRKLQKKCTLLADGLNTTKAAKSLIAQRDSLLTLLGADVVDRKQLKAVKAIKAQILADRAAQKQYDRLVDRRTQLKEDIKDQKLLLTRMMTEDNTTTKLSDFLSRTQEFDHSSPQMLLQRSTEERRRLAQASNNNKNIADLDKRISEDSERLGIDPQNVDKATVEEEIASDATVISTYLTFKQHASADSKICPVCSSEVDITKLKTSAKKAKIRLRRNEDVLALLDITDERSSLSMTCVKSLTENQVCQAEIDALVKTSELLAKADIEFDRLRSLKRKLVVTNQSIEELPDILGETYDEEEIDRQIASMENDIRVRSELDKVRDLYTTDISDDFDEAILQDIENDSIEMSSRLNAYTKKFNTASDRKVHAEIYASKKSMLMNRKEVLTQKVDRLSKLLLDKPILLALVDAYASKGLKLHKIRTIANILVDNLNRYRPLLFSEQFVFDCSVVDNNFDLIVDRGNGLVSDVRKLSKSEGYRFDLLLMLSLLPLTKNRISLTIMDEMDSGFSETNKRLFREEFIPKLHEVVPNIVIVTPDQHHYAQSVDVFVVKSVDGTADVKCSVPELVA